MNPQPPVTTIFIESSPAATTPSVRILVRTGVRSRTRRTSLTALNHILYRGCRRAELRCVLATYCGTVSYGVSDARPQRYGFSATREPGLIRVRVATKLC